jgi:hypothetical protein
MLTRERMTILPQKIQRPFFRTFVFWVITKYSEQAHNKTLNMQGMCPPAATRPPQMNAKCVTTNHPQMNTDI